jgi:hypothetical protein
MDATEPTREGAAAAVAEAGHRTGQVRHADLQLRWMLLAVLGADAVVAVLMSVSLERGSRLAPLGIVGALVAAIVFGLIVGLRIRAYSRAGIRIYFAAIIAFNLWNAIVISTSIVAGFWRSGQPAYHFGISEAIAALPLVIGAGLVGRRS